ncbi:unnamed protein product [Mycena citricolor]|uniref:Uncharacterized protein n=1 Tax=Mycena citricolor TaxID=2018698 RepID=A0AAD2Q209_9AGAR|nr:unnamed protein product [Mycena citricolor]
MRALHSRLCHHRPERTVGGHRRPHPRFPEALRVSRFPRVHRHPHLGRIGHHFLCCTSMGQEEYALVHLCVQHDRGHQCQRHYRSGSVHCHNRTRRQPVQALVHLFPAWFRHYHTSDGGLLSKCRPRIVQHGHGYELDLSHTLYADASTVTPTYYVIFTFFSIVTTIVLFKGLAASPSSIITLVMGFLVICVGITILQMSKVDPEELSKKLDRRSTILLQAARSQTESMEEKHHLGIEDPGMDTLRGSFGAVGSIIRARSARRLSQSSSVGRPPGAAAPYDRTRANSTNPRLPPVERHQLYDAPMPSLDLENRSVRSDSNATTPGPGVLGKRTTIKFGTEDVVHQYHPTGGQSGTPRRDDAAIHSSRPVVESPLVMTTGLPPADGGYPPGRSREETDSQRGGGLAGVGANGSNDLLLGELDEHPPPSLATHGSMTSLRDQSIAVSEAYSNESHMTRSAPPTMAPRFPGARRMDSRDIFSKDEQSGQVRGSPQSGTLLSFPSVTDSARSANWEDGAPSERGRSTRKYPRTGTEDDRDESVSLWNRGRDSPDDLAQDSGDSAENTIRLVQPRF